MHLRRLATGWSLALAVSTSVLTAAEGTPKVPRFSVDNMDRTADPSVDFFRFAAGNWVKSNPVPADKSRWGGFDELQDRNWFLLREILESAAKDAGSSAAARVKKSAPCSLS